MNAWSGFWEMNLRYETFFDVCALTHDTSTHNPFMYRFISGEKKCRGYVPFFHF